MKTEYSGVWWSPKFQNVKLPGVLKIEGDNIELALYAEQDFRGIPFSESSDGVDMYRVILGESRGHKITLLNCSFSGSDSISDTLNTFGVRPEVVIDGKHYNTSDEIVFDRISCSYSFLSAWMEDLSKASEFSHIETPLQDFDDRLHKQVSIDIGDGLTLQIVQFLRKHHITQRRKTSFEIHHVVNILSKDVKSFETFKLKVHEFRKFLELSLTTSVSVWFHSAGVSGSGQESIRFYYPQIKSTKPNTSSDFFPHARMLLSYYKLTNKEFPFVIANWFKTISKYGIVYDFFLDTNKWFEGTGASITSVMFNNRVLNMIQGLESFHMLARGSELESKGDFETKFNELTSGLSADQIQWLRKRSGPLHKDLRTRLTELVEEFGFMLEKVLLSSKDRKSFIHHVKEIRDMLSHARHTEPDVGINNEPLYVASRILLLTCILHTLGLDKVRIKELINRASDYHRELSFCEQMWKH